MPSVIQVTGKNMKRNLRKGSSSVHFEYSDGGESIRADTFEAETVADILTLSFRLRPVDDNERMDEENLHTKNLLSISIDDKYIIDGLTSYLKHYPASSMQLCVISKGKNLSFSVVLEERAIDHFSLIVQLDSS